MVELELDGVTDPALVGTKQEHRAELLLPVVVVMLVHPDGLLGAVVEVLYPHQMSKSPGVLVPDAQPVVPSQTNVKVGLTCG